MEQAKELHGQGPSMRKNLVRMVVDVVRLTKTVKVIIKLPRKISKVLIYSKNSNINSLMFNVYRIH